MQTCLLVSILIGRQPVQRGKRSFPSGTAHKREHNSSNIQRLLADVPVGFDFDRATARSTREAQLSEWHRIYYITGNILLLLL